MKVFLDAGHGGTDPGATGFGRIEKNDVYELVEMIGQHLTRSGATVGYSRPHDVLVSLSERCNIANRNKADYFISIHRNAGGGTGAETWIHSNNVAPDRKLAESIQKELAVFYKNRGVKVGYPGQPTGNFAINRESNMPSCLVEVGFMDTQGDNEIFGKNGEAIALCIARGIARSAKLAFKEPQAPIPPTPAPTPAPKPPQFKIKAKLPGVTALAMGHTAFMGWDEFANSVIGTTHKGLRLEAFLLGIEGISNFNLSGRIHMADKGWVSYSDIKRDTILGTTGEDRQIEAIELTLNNANGKKIEYRVQVAVQGWKGWKTQGETAGTQGEKLAIEAIEFRLV